MNHARPWTHAALFGALWGALELSVGTFLKLSRLPLSGLVMTLLGLACLITLRRLQPTSGVCLLAGVCAAVLKVLALGGLYPGPVIGILVEASVVEAVLSMGGGGRVATVIAGALSAAANPLQMLIMVRIVAGAEAVNAYRRAALAGLEALHLPWLGPGAILAAVVASAAVVGAVGGLVSWRVAGRVIRRLGAFP